MVRSSEPNRYASDAIKDLIRARGLEPGDLMPTEAELVVELGVSRSSIREAVRTLTALDILEVRHGTGTFVGQLSLKPLVEGMVFRGVLLPGDGLQSLREIIDYVTFDGAGRINMVLTGGATAIRFNREADILGDASIGIHSRVSDAKGQADAIAALDDLFG